MPLGFGEVHLLAAALASAAPVPKLGPKYTVTKLEKDEELPDLGKNPHNIDESYYSAMNRVQDDNIHLYVIKDRENAVAGVILHQAPPLNAVLTPPEIRVVLGSGVTVKFDNDMLTVGDSKGKSELTMRENALGEKYTDNPNVLINGPTKGDAAIIETDKKTSKEELNLNPRTGKIRVELGDKTQGTVLEIRAPARDAENLSPLEVQVAVPDTLLDGAKSSVATGFRLNGKDLKTEEGRVAITTGKGDNVIEAKPVHTTLDGETQFNEHLNVSVVTKTAKGEGTIELLKKGVPQKDEEALDKTIKGLKAKTPEPDKGKGR